MCGVHMAESVFTGLVFTLLVGRNFVSGICKLKLKKKLKKPKNLKPILFCFKNYVFPALLLPVTSLNVNRFSKLFQWRTQQ